MSAWAAFQMVAENASRLSKGLDKIFSRTQNAELCFACRLRAKVNSFQ
jgi:hypothetical protein